ncbi:hypothetical protein SERLA73DRAFT_172493 [Serpula lacrymans var. lacrymans S7.3]|uniref:NAD-dependent epimerase/dehydratase domain-containing protein n=1 Tax=Serpula lacrymans var. lacrymans (strain S7.3) TaxID=936435 RepID=F8QFJ8_SERL3|nr:hypothetical protein SERLA73DRAFT_172493 [Serpula lacrymans var. lacrymans S7.3]
MPAIAPPSKVLVTGANGFIAVWLVNNLLERGYTVRGTVRSEAKAQYLRERFSSYGDKHEVVVVEDVTKDGAFDEAVKDIDGILHTASPCHVDADDPNEVIVPAVRGTISIMESALKYGPSVKRIIVTSSCATINKMDSTSVTYTEADWAEQTIQAVKEKGRDAGGMIKYRASKTLAEKAAWEFYETHKGAVAWELAVINPPWPSIHDVSTPENLNSSTLTWYKNIIQLASEGATNDLLAVTGACYVDVRDLVEAHALALEKAAAGGERFIVSAGISAWQDFIDAGNKLDPPPRLSLPLRKSLRNTGITNPAPVYFFDSSKATRILGIKFRSLAETTKDTLADYEERGW